MSSVEILFGQVQYLTYTNWRGETRLRKVFPRRLVFTSTKWHKEAQWLVECWDCEDGKVKQFALSGFKTDELPK